jgi:hypothetical protein
MALRDFFVTRLVTNRHAASQIGANVESTRKTRCHGSNNKMSAFVKIRCNYNDFRLFCIITQFVIDNVTSLS